VNFDLDLGTLSVWYEVEPTCQMDTQIPILDQLMCLDHYCKQIDPLIKNTLILELAVILVCAYHLAQPLHAVHYRRVLIYNDTRKLSSIEDRGLTDRTSNWNLTLTSDYDLQSRKLEWKQADR